MKNFHREIQKTADGAVTLYIPEIDEHYHSVNGAITEALHVYITEALNKRIESAHDKKDVINILEVGFGTGLNAFLTLIKSIENNINIVFTTLELYPLNTEVVNGVNYPDLVGAEYKDYFKSLHSAEWNKVVSVNENFSIEKVNVDLKDYISEKKFDVIYYDAFAPEKQPEMWNDDIYNKLFSMSNNGCVITTYCAKGVVRRGLRDAGFTMERIPGPPGKREMIRGTKNID